LFGATERASLLSFCVPSRFVLGVLFAKGGLFAASDYDDGFCVYICVCARAGLFVDFEFRSCFLPALFPYFAFVRGLVVVLMAVSYCFRV
jgi:hypothetical protein